MQNHDSFLYNVPQIKLRIITWQRLNNSDTKLKYDQSHTMSFIKKGSIIEHYQLEICNMNSITKSNFSISTSLKN